MFKLHRYLHCQQCLKANMYPSIEVGVMVAGELIIRCYTHDLELLCLYPESAKDQLHELVGTECSNPGCKCKETVH